MRDLKFPFVALCLYAVFVLGTQATMSISAAVVFAAGVWLAVRQRESRREFGRGWKVYAELSFAFVLCFIVSLLGAWLFPLVYGGRTALVHGPLEIAKAWYFAWPVVLCWLLLALSDVQRKRVFWIWLSVAGVLGWIGIAQHWTGWPRPQEIPRDVPGPVRFHATLFLGHHLSVASVLIFPFFVALDVLYARVRDWAKLKTTGQKLLVLAGGLTVLAMGLTLFFTYSRTLWIALPIGLLVWIGASLPRRWSAPLLVALIVGGIGTTQLPAVKARLDQVMGIQQRMRLWDVNWEFFKQRPLTGVGWLKNEELSGYALIDKFHTTHVFAGRAHNNILEVLAGLGLLGLFVWGAWCVWITLRFWRLGRAAHRGTADARKTFAVAWGPLCAWIVFHLNGLTQVNLWEGKVQHQLFWMIAWAGVWRVLSQTSSRGAKA